MTQAFFLAESMFMQGSLKSAQPSALIVNDGKPPFAWRMNEAVAGANLPVQL